MSKKIFTTLCSFLLTAVLLIGAVPVFAEGSLESNLSWRIEGTTMYVEGEGEMQLTYEYLPEIPWYAEGTAAVENLIIGEGITYIDEGAFNAFR